MIPFSRPRIDQEVIDEVVATLRSGWITTGPRTKSFEERLVQYCGCRAVVAVSSWTMGMQVFLHWWGIGPGDEVIVPAYTYCATANVIVRAGATPVVVDINPTDFNISTDAIARAITVRTKAVIAVDVAGMPCDYPAIHDVVTDVGARRLFRPTSAQQESLGRIVVIGDAAHSLGATVGGVRTGALCDVTCFSFHAVKNLTTAEGGALCFNLPAAFDHEGIYREFCALVLHGQDVDAMAKAKRRTWRYDVKEPGFKCNMTDLHAAIGLVELGRYQENLDRRRDIFATYDAAFRADEWALLPPHASGARVSSCHVYQLRVRGATEQQRDAIIEAIFDQGVAVNVHFMPLPLLTAYRNREYTISDCPQSWDKYHNEISLPVYCDLTDDQVRVVVEAVKCAVRGVLGDGLSAVIPVVGAQ